MNAYLQPGASLLTSSRSNGGQFEFLPVTITGANAVLKAILRVSVGVGFTVATPKNAIPGLNMSAGVSATVFANLAEFTTNVTYLPQADDKGCNLKVTEDYRLAIGAAAGASVQLNNFVWGPVPATIFPLYQTTFLDACAASKTATTAKPTATASKRGFAGRQALTTTTISTEIAVTATQCQSVGLIDCPASLQSIAKTKFMSTIVTAVAAGVKATFPTSILDSVPTTVPFGDNVKNLFQTATSEVPNLIPTILPTSFPSINVNITEIGDAIKDTGDAIKDTVGGVDKRIIIGASVGVGVFILIAVGGSIL